MKQVVVFPTGQLTQKDKERLTKAGIVAVEASCPKDVIMLLPSSSLCTGDDLLLSAIAGVNGGSDYCKVLMVKELCKRIIEREQTKERT